MSAPSVLQTRRNGKFPTVVKGARYSLSLKSIVLFSSTRAFVNAPVSVRFSSSTFARFAALSSPAFVCSSFFVSIALNTSFTIVSALEKSYFFLRNRTITSLSTKFISFSTVFGGSSVVVDSATVAPSRPSPVACVP